MPTSTWDLLGNSANAAGAFLGTTDAQPLVIKTVSVERMRVDKDGNVAIGTSTPAARLGVVASAAGPSVFASCDQGIAIRAQSQTDTGVFATSDKGLGVDARSNSNVAVTASSQQAIAVRATATKDTGVFATSDSGMGLDARSNSNIGVQAVSQTNTALFATSTSGLGVDARSTQGIAIRAQAQGDTAMFATSNGGRGVDGRSTTGVGVYGEGGQSAGYFHGNVVVTGDVLLTGADCAEHFDVVAGEHCPDAGTVLVIDHEGLLKESCEAYDRKVAGVVSGAGDYRHAIVLDKKATDENRVPVALVGKVYCKVDAQYAAIEIGDLLTSSPTPGHAMKASEPTRAFGAVLGKALRPLARGTGLIPVLIALQ